MYRVSLDELLGIDVKTFKTPEYPHSSSDMDARTIRLTKSGSDELNYMFEDTSSKRVVYPKDSLDKEIYPKGVEPPQYQEPIQSNSYNNVNPMSTAYRQSNPIVTTQDNTYSKHGKKKKKKRPFVPPYTNNKFINWFESFMAKHKISYKGLYTFPIYAIGIALAILSQEIFYYSTANCFTGISLLGIPLYYTAIKSIQTRNPNFFGYPILAIMLTLFTYAGINSDISALWLATIPFYYWFVNKDK